MYTAFQIITQIVFKCHKHYIFCFSLKLMDGLVLQGSLDHWNPSETPVIISLPDEVKFRKNYLRRQFHIFKQMTISNQYGKEKGSLCCWKVWSSSPSWRRYKNLRYFTKTWVWSLYKDLWLIQGTFGFRQIKTRGRFLPGKNIGWREQLLKCHETAGASGVTWTSRFRILQRLALMQKPSIQPPLNNAHKQKRLQWAQKYMKTNFQTVVPEGMKMTSVN